MKAPGIAKRKPVPRPAWANRFATPVLNALLHPLRSTHAAPFRHARERLLAIPGMKEQIAWQGVWRWTLVYTHASLPGQVWAFLVPDPSQPLLSVPIPESALASLPPRRVTRTIRDGLSLAPVIAGVRWATWQLTSKTLAEDILAVAAARATPARNDAATAARRAS